MRKLLAPRQLFGIRLLLWATPRSGRPARVAPRGLVVAPTPTEAPVSVDVTNAPILNFTNLRNEVILLLPLSLHGFYRLKH